MTVTPSGVIYLCETPLENDNKNQLTFSDKNSQYNYFSSTIKKSYDNYTYIKKDNVIYVGENIDNIINCNYLFYRNNGFTDKYYYCFITNMSYESENCTAVTFETDCFQTWQFDINYNKCFVEREHVNNDSIGLHTVPENLELGEYINQENYTMYGLSDACVCIASTWDSYQNKAAPTRHYNGLFSGISFFVFKDVDYSTVQVYDSASYFLEALDGQGKNDSCQAIFMIPKKLVDYDNIQWDGPGGTGLQYYYYKKLPESQLPSILDNFILAKNYSNINGYVPKNNKLFTFPYNALELDNNNGTSAIFKYEDFSTDNIQFKIVGSVAIGASIKAIPLNYKGTQENDNESIIAGKFPTCNWFSDAFTNWLTQQSVNFNGVNVPIGILSGTGQIVGQAAATGTISMSGVSQIGSTLLQVYQHSFMSPQSLGNINAGDVTYSDKKNDFIAYKKVIKAEYAKIIDDYFSMFGYKINSLKIPNIKGRLNWNYVKTIDCNFTGNIPQTDLNKIRSMFNLGVTFWHNPNTIYNYSNSNYIV